MVVRTFGEDVRARLLQRHPLPPVRAPEIRLNVRSRSTRSSRTNRRPTGSENERFELLESFGDTVLNDAIGRVVYRHLTRAPQASPAIFSAYRSLLQSNYTFSLIALAYDLGSQLDPPFAVPFSDRDVLNDSARKTLGDALEALVGGLEVDGQHETVERWLDGVFAILCEWADEQTRQADGGPVRELINDHMARFVASRTAVRPPTLCACWKHGLTACGNRDTFRYGFKCEQVFRVTLETTHSGESYTAVSTTKKVAENEAAQLALLDLDPDAAASLTHFCGLDS